jgi:hypothetical protein
MKKLARPGRDNLPGISSDFKMPKNFKMQKILFLKIITTR